MKGFSLVELLAVVIILAIIALIATPIVLNVIEDARISAGKSEASMIYSGINNYCATSKMEQELNGTHDICADGVTVEEVTQMVNLGDSKLQKVKFEAGKLTELEIVSNSHIFKLCNNGDFVMDNESCDTSEVDDSKQPSEGNLITTLLNQYDENSDTGLIKDTTNPNIYYYKGSNEDVNNNYLWYGGHHWRIIEIDTSSKSLILISTQPLTAIQATNVVWMDVDTYDNTYINDWLNNYFYNSLASNVKQTIKDNTFNIGLNTDVTSLSVTKKVGLLDEQQYERAGGADSYLDIKDYWWLGNYNSTYIRYVALDGIVNDGNLTSAGGVRPVIKISDLMITGGEGTLESNYVTGQNITNIADIQVGEYINVPYSGDDYICNSSDKCTFRVVSKDADSVKVVLNGLLYDTSLYGYTAAITPTHIIYETLNNFINNISLDYRYNGNKLFYIGEYSSGTSYLDVQNEYLDINVGLPTVGEMFSGNDIDMGTTKIFVNIDAVENPTISNNYWLMNRYSSSQIRYSNNTGSLGNYMPAIAYGVRPTLYLKNDLNFISGIGTAESPYELQ